MSLGYALAYPTDVGWLCPCGWRHGDTPRNRTEPTDPIMQPLKRGTPHFSATQLVTVFIDRPIEKRPRCRCEALSASHSLPSQTVSERRKVCTHKNPMMTRGPSPAHRGRRGAARVSRLLSLLTWSHSAPPPIKSKRFVFNGLLR